MQSLKHGPPLELFALGQAMGPDGPPAADHQEVALVGGPKCWGHQTDSDRHTCAWSPTRRTEGCEVGSCPKTMRDNSNIGKGIW